MGKISWRFPENNDGNEYGFNDSGIETFMGNKWESVAKEVIQNALDAKQEGEEHVVVKFSKMKYNTKMFPGKELLNETFIKCSNYYSSHPKVTRFFREANSLMNADSIDMLRISDFNTVGLNGSMDDVNSNLYKLLKGTGVSNKSAGSSGSFGIGKHAPFALSKFRTLFYHSVRAENDEVFQGVSILTTHIDQNLNKTQGKGYYGYVEKNQPLVKLNSFPEFATRKELGTDIIIPAVEFNKDWIIKIIQSVIDQFLISILESELIIHVDDIVIDTNSLTSLFEKYYKRDSGSPYTSDYFEAYESKDSRNKVIEICGLGEIEIRILRKANGCNRVGYFRNGMKIIDKGNFQTSMRFSGVMMVRGSELNEFLRLLEPPRHDKWEAGRHDDEKFAGKVIDDIRIGIRDLINEISKETLTEESDMDYLKNLLPDTSSDTEFDDNDGVLSKDILPVNDIKKPKVSYSNTINVNVKRETVREGKEGYSESPGLNEGDFGENDTTGGSNAGSTSSGQGDGEITTTASKESGKELYMPVRDNSIRHKLLGLPEGKVLRLKLYSKKDCWVRIDMLYRGESSSDKSKMEISNYGYVNGEKDDIYSIGINSLKVKLCEGEIGVIEIEPVVALKSAYEVKLYEIC